MNKKLLFGIIAGILTGLFAPGFAAATTPIGNAYLALFRMCALPIILTAVIISFARLLRASDSKVLIARTVVVFVAGASLASVLGLFFSYLISSTLVNNEDFLAALSRLVSQAPASSAAAPYSFGAFLSSIIPSNIFAELARGNTISCLFFAILFGIFLGKGRPESTESLIGVLQASNETLSRIIHSFTAILPIGMFCIFAKTFSNFGGGEVVFLLRLIAYGAIAIVMLDVALLSVVYFFSRSNLKNGLDSLKEPVLIAFSTTSSISGIPSALETIPNGFGIEKRFAEMILPLGTTFGAIGSVFFDAFIASLMCRLHGIPLGLGEMGYIFIGSILQAICSSGLPAIVGMGTFAVIFGSIGLPMEPITALLLAIMPMLDPLVSATNLLGYCISAIGVGKWVQRRERDPARAPVLQPSAFFRPRRLEIFKRKSASKNRRFLTYR